MTPYSKDVELAMVTFFCSLREKDRRRYAAVEAAKLGDGGGCLMSPTCLASIRKRFAKVKQTSKTYRTFLPRMSGKKGRQKKENRRGS